MNTHLAEYRTEIARFVEDMAKRETGMLPSVAAMIGFGTAVLSFIP